MPTAVSHGEEISIACITVANNGEVMSIEDLGQTECERRIENRKCTTKFLAKLIKHHATPIPVEKTVTAPVVKPWFSIIDAEPRAPMVEDIKRAGARYFKLANNDLESARRVCTIAYPRHIVMYLAKTLTGKSFPDIGRRLGGRDHTTVIHGVRKIEAAIKTDWKVAYDVAHVEAML
jgi:chromosomal replication initiation ATPase DnaA